MKFILFIILIISTLCFAQDVETENMTVQELIEFVRSHFPLNSYYETDTSLEIVFAPEAIEDFINKSNYHSSELHNSVMEQTENVKLQMQTIFALVILITTILVTGICLFIFKTIRQQNYEIKINESYDFIMDKHTQQDQEEEEENEMNVEGDFFDRASHDHYDENNIVVEKTE
jgi:uncharacterized protein YxeA